MIFASLAVFDLLLIGSVALAQNQTTTLESAVCAHGNGSITSGYVDYGHGGGTDDGGSGGDGGCF